MRKVFSCLLILSMNSYAAEPAHETLRGYTAAHSAAEVQWETKFRAMPDTERLRENMRRLSARPHHVGSPYDKDNAEWLLAQLKSYGLDAKIEQFESLFPTPKSRKLELLGPEKFTATLQEPAIAVDPTSGTACLRELWRTVGL
jgi:N-acetylated-alpha-linked acidic dipeptidase